MKKVYLDSCFVIYLIEEVPNFSSIARAFFTKNIDNHFCISPLVRLEVLVHPKRSQNQRLVEDYEDFLAELEMLPLIDEVFDQALRLRVSDSLKTPDALHLGAAIVHGCSEFWTRNDRLSRVSRRMAINIFSAVNGANSAEVGGGAIAE